MRKILKRIAHPFLKRITKIWFFKPRKYSYKGIEVMVHPSVFPPHYTISTKILLNFVNGLPLHNKSFLELGCGSGIISLLASSKGANVVASDINVTALEYLKKSAKKNHLELEIVNSNFFSNISQSSFDIIIINPPYYPKKPKNIEEEAWYCGENFEYFVQLFQQLHQRKEDQQLFMILSIDCEIKKIQQIAQEYHFTFQCILKKKVQQEKNFIFKLIKQ